MEKTNFLREDARRLGRSTPGFADKVTYQGNMGDCLERKLRSSLIPRYTGDAWNLKLELAVVEIDVKSVFFLSVPKCKFEKQFFRTNYIKNEGKVLTFILHVSNTAKNKLFEDLKSVHEIHIPKSSYLCFCL